MKSIERSKSGEQTGDDSPEVIEKKDKAIAVFGQNYETAQQLRDFERGWQNYETKDGLTFLVLVDGAVDRCRNSAEIAIKDGSEMDSKFMDEELENLERARESLVRFEEKGELKVLMAPIRDKIDELRKNMKSGDAMKIFESAVSLKSFYSGFMHINEAFLAPAEEASR